MTAVPKAEDMTGADVIRLAEERGFKVLLRSGPPPMPVLHGVKADVTIPLMEALKAFREEIIAELESRNRERANECGPYKDGF